jgi:ankyrin repeat protein
VATQHTAAESGWRGKNAIELLLKYGLDVDARIQSSGATALMMAARSGADESVKLLLNAGAKVNAKAGESLYGMTALCTLTLLLLLLLLLLLALHA